MYIQEQWTEVKTIENSLGEIDFRSYMIGESDIYEPYTDNIGDLFLSLQREYGRCQSKVYIDTSEGVKAIGWVFQKRQKYQDCNDTYLSETWVTLHEEKPTLKTTYRYRFL
jgi:hypothetical protein